MCDGCAVDVCFVKRSEQRPSVGSWTLRIKSTFPLRSVDCVGEQSQIGG
jgi:hypothetical protein